MRSLKHLFQFEICLLLLLFVFRASAFELKNPDTALADYINFNDNVFDIQSLASMPGNGFSLHFYNLVSQQWLTNQDIDRSIWNHTLVIVIPDTVSSSTAMLVVAGNDNNDPLPDQNDIFIQIITQLAVASQSIVSAVYQVPNQPILFKDSGIARAEDTLVSYSWKKALDTADYKWAAYLPMVKSVVRAMDGIQDETTKLGNYNIDDFVLTGFSKRGAAVWLTAAVDNRVKAIAPGVIDFLNVIPSIEHQFKSYGEFSSAIKPYEDSGLLSKIRSPEFARLAQVIDPYSYLDKLTMPKFILNSSGDQFFLPDSSRFYFGDLKGESLIHYAPNTDHSLSSSVTGFTDTLYSLLGWYQSILTHQPRPEINWLREDQQIIAHTSIPPQRVQVWTAYNPVARDFRKSSIGEVWLPSPIEADLDGNYRVTLKQPAIGYNATYIEFVYPGASGLPITYSTGIFISPDIEPFDLPAAINHPKTSRYWQQQVDNVINGEIADIDLQSLQSYLPIHVFQHIYSTPADLLEALSLSAKHAPDKIALSECTASRLNLAAKEIHWYSPVDLGGFLGNKPLWEHYKMADAWAEDWPWMSANICRQLNRVHTP